MENLKDFMKQMQLNSQLSLDDIPNLDLYMDQVIQLFESTFEGLKRDEQEKVLTKTMINNYAKGKLFYPIENKKYSKDHLMLIAMIYQLKGALSINDVKTTLYKLNKMVVEDNFELAKLYESYVQLADESMKQLESEMKQLIDDVEHQSETLASNDADYLQELLLVASFVNMSNYYRRAAEKMVDRIATKNDK
ncbi:DUF1836 domain-containing protein [Virgibacillus pantothenticus]|uniref:Cytoplasmic protein n=2 Tax=Virgibacillus TaxID=84406 RepID=A0A0L0QMK2_VIRPA|nr:MULTISPECIES: DUF1836 domain-containing protein [Virgibacillus]API93538.1 hypothetical protein BKP57_18020 [Virgibacillus sp. 6R]KNE19832.1 hypothetical protein AFK71_15540 [Virgibacillus pantothenticus]MBS7430076.1 DUF1836 domain-containing protein [Virgibacillus sp. 19R1-5]MBU8566346.1 DUF1836 domain-containing protein [Virgibacillus pantothenticus]MBU8600769.1 DUF1836 domain-containing protein [Virgibacillus pantothenticus]